jgi:myo-inositol-1(or 4)-monophosphatase
VKDFPDIDADDRGLLEAALEAGRVAAQVHRGGAARLDPSAWTEKGPADFVTEVDREAERRILEILGGRFPGHAFLAEEGSGGDPDAAGTAAPFRWIVDPLDGTTNWLHGYPEHAVSIAGADAGGPRVAVVVNSATGETFTAIRGHGARRDGAPIRVSGVERLHLALVGTGFPFKQQALLPGYLETLGRVIASTSGVRRGGAAALDLCDLACGRLDAFWETWLMPWDVAAGALIVREAGGAFGPLPPPLGPEPGEPRPPEVPELGSGGYLASNAALADTWKAFLYERGEREPWTSGT